MHKWITSIICKKLCQSLWRIKTNNYNWKKKRQNKSGQDLIAKIYDDSKVTIQNQDKNYCRGGLWKLRIYYFQCSVGKPGKPVPRAVCVYSAHSYFVFWFNVFFLLFLLEYFKFLPLHIQIFSNLREKKEKWQWLNVVFFLFFAKHSKYFI